MKKIFKNEKGIGGADALIAISILVMFVGLISTMVYNIYLVNTGIKRQATAIEYIKNIFGYVEKSDYEDINVNSIYNYILEDKDLFNNSKNKIDIYSNEETSLSNTIQGKNAYTIGVNIEKLNKQEENLDKLDLVMKVTVKIGYKIGNKNKTLEMYTIKSKEKIIVPNKPDLTLLSSVREVGDNIYAIKKENNIWKVTNLGESNWYNYFDGNWATILRTNQNLNSGDIVETLNDKESMYIWIPKYAYLLEDNNIEDLVFLYKNTLNYVGGENSTLLELQDNYVESFSGNGMWLNIEDIEDNEIYEYLNQKYENRNLFEE